MGELPVFHGWDGYYLLVGSAAGALIGIMFVIATLTAGLNSKRVAQGLPVYMTPVLFHLTAIVVISALTAVPRLPDSAAGVVIGALAILGAAYSGSTLVRLFGADWVDAPEWSDRCFYGALPTIGYLALAYAALSIWEASSEAPYVVGATAMLLLLICIRNAWELATFITQYRRDAEDSDPGSGEL